MMNDSELYVASKNFVIQKLSDCYNKTEDVLILSVSRKGPKFLERLFGRADNETLNTITEVALPFCMKRLAGIKKNWRIMVFDDAVYYGTTVEGVIHELEAFENLYAIESKKELYTAVRAKESHANFKENLNNVTVHSYNDDKSIHLRNGYGHYFIRRLERDLSDSGNTLEIEFPIIEFEADKPVDRDNLFASLIEIYGADKCYIVNHYEDKSLSIELDESEGQSFSKIRVYIKDTCIRVVCMTPWILPNEILVMVSLFKDTPFFGIWLNLMSAYTDPVIGRKRANAYTFMQVDRTIKKSLIIMANYLLSCGQFLTQKGAILEAFLKSEIKARYKGIHTSDLFYLLGDKVLCKEIQDKVNDLWEIGVTGNEINLSKPNCKIPTVSLNYQIFEHQNFPEQEEYDLFERHNKDMLGQCKNANEALSALFYNQTALIEKWSRRSEQYDFGRLRFGYTYSSLTKDLSESGINGDNLKLTKRIHQWVDHRIDQACIVPQYIVDYKTNLWCRVFRPGENEDALLSHLTRYVLSVFNSMDQVQRLGWIQKDLFEELLCLSVYNVEELKDSFEFELIPDMVQRKLLFNYGIDSSKRNVLEYLTDMNILKIDNDMVSVSKELADDDLRLTTTLDYDVEKSIHDKISEIMGYVAKLKYQQYPFFVTNLYFYNSDQINDIVNYNKNYLNSLSETVNMIERGASKQDLSLYIYNNYFSSKKYIVSIEVFTNDDIMTSLFINTREKLQYARELIVMWMIKFLYELIIVTHLHDNFNALKSELETAMSFEAYGYRLEWDEDTLNYFRQLIEQTEEVQEIRNRSLMWVKNMIVKIPNVKV